MNKKLPAVCLALALLTGCGANIGQQSDSDGISPSTMSMYENGEVFVQYKNGTFDVLSFEEERFSQELEQLARDEAVAWIQPNYSYAASALSTTDALSSYQWALSNDGSFQMEERKNQYPVYEFPFEIPYDPWQWIMPEFTGMPGGFWGMVARTSDHRQVSAVPGIDINIEAAWSAYDGGSRDVVIALIDTGIDYTHEDLQGALWRNEDEIPGNGVDDDGNGYVDDVYGWNFYNNNNRAYVDGDSHGTHGAGTMAAVSGNGTGISGIVNSPHVKIMSVKALGGWDGSGSTASIIRAIQYAEANGASICNLSLGNSVNDRALYQAIANSSMLFVVAAGNDGANTDTSPIYPASYDLDNIISVANLNYNGALHYSSNYGAASVDLAAPGSYILSTTPGDGYSYMTGTSMAAPMVTASAAMVYSHYPDITLADVKEILLSTVTKLDALSGSSVTGGMLNLGAAMNYDTSTLPHKAWQAPASVYNGTAPEISIATLSQWGGTYLVVQITDIDNDLAAVAYSPGTLTADQFMKGSAGEKISLDSAGRKVFSVNSNGVYTFYAVDSMGNETVKTVSVTAAGPRGGWYSPFWPGW